MPITQRTAVSVTSGGSNSTTSVLTRHSSWVAGDVAVMEVAYTNGSALTPPSGWTLIDAVRSNSTSISTGAYWRLIDGTETSWTWTIGTSARIGIVSQAFAGVDTTAPIITSTQTHTGAALTTATLTSSTDVPYLLTIWGARVTSTAGPSITPPGTHTSITSTATTQAGTTVQLVVNMTGLTTQPTATGSFGPYTATNVTPDAVAHRQIALKTQPLPPPVLTYTRTNEVWLDSDSTQSGVVTLTQTSGTAATITEPVTGTFRIVLPASFSSDLVFRMTATANGQTDIEDVTVTPGSGGTTVNDVLTWNGTAWV
jgi:hypothetical protein